MKNADTPAIPIESCIINSSGQFTGLTKREMFAMHAMMAVTQTQILATFKDTELLEDVINAIASDAIMLADAVLLELEQTK